MSAIVLAENDFNKTYLSALVDAIFGDDEFKALLLAHLAQTIGDSDDFGVVFSEIDDFVMDRIRLATPNKRDKSPKNQLVMERPVFRLAVFLSLASAAISFSSTAEISLPHEPQNVASAFTSLPQCLQCIVEPSVLTHQQPEIKVAGGTTTSRPDQKALCTLCVLSSKKL